MNFRIIFGIISIYEAVNISLWSLFQADIIPETFYKVLEQFPVVVGFFVVAYYMRKWQREDAKTSREQQQEDAALRRQQQKEDNTETRQWLESLLAMQRQILTDSSKANQIATDNIIKQLSVRLTEVIEVVKALTNKVATMEATVSESARVDDVLKELMEQLDASRRGL